MTANRRAAVLGHPIAHSLSPALHRAAYRALGLDWTYEAVDVTAEQLASQLDRGPEWVGLSLTMPLKEAVLPLLTDIDPIAERVRSVNTVLLDGPRRRGYNTDVIGLRTVLTETSLPVAASVTLLGGGATARSALAALAELNVADVAVSTRRPEVAAEMLALAELLEVPATAAPWPPSEDLLQRDLVVSTVPAEASSQLARDVPAAPHQLVDVLYDGWPTPFATGWIAAGGSVASGLELLVYQAVEQIRLMTGAHVASSILREAGQAELDRRNIAQAEQ
jgi:shikimate dehydrogenase